MKIAVTGASGFIGTELLAELNTRNDVKVIALTRDASEHDDTERCEWRSTDYSQESLSAALGGVDAVIHLAGVRGTEADPEKFTVNEDMTENILKTMADLGIKRMVFASTVSVYDNEDLMPWTEEAPLKGRTAYGDSKIRCEKLIKKYAADHDFTYGIARIAQVLGEGEKRRGMMNVFIDTAREHGILKVMGKSVAKRQYIYVRDLVKILAMLTCGDNAINIEENIIVNAGMPNAYSNLEIAGLVNGVFGNPVPIDYDDSYPEKGRAFFMDISRLQNELGYRPLDMAEALEKLAER